MKTAHNYFFTGAALQRLQPAHGDGADAPGVDSLPPSIYSSNVESPVTFLSNNFQLMGVLHTPDDIRNSAPAVVFLHGFSGTKVEPHRIFVKTARALVQRGFVTLRFDFRGSGDSSGECEDATLTGEIADAQTALRFLMHQPQVDANRIGIIGMSLGGAVACHVAALEPCVKSLALWSPVADGNAIIQRIATPAAANSLLNTGFADLEGWRVSRKFVEEFRSMRPAAELAKSGCHVLIIHGSADPSVPVEQVDIFEKALASAPAARKFRKCIIPDANHTFDRADWEETAIRVTVEWLVTTV